MQQQIEYIQRLGEFAGNQHPELLPDMRLGCKRRQPQGEAQHDQKR